MADPPNNLRAWRKFRDMTQQQLADEMGTAKSVVSDLERGVVQLSETWLKRLAVPLGTKPGRILDHTPDTLPHDILGIWARIHEKDREHAARVLSTFMTLPEKDDQP